MLFPDGGGSSPGLSGRGSFAHLQGKVWLFAYLSGVSPGACGGGWGQKPVTPPLDTRLTAAGIDDDGNTPAGSCGQISHSALGALSLSNSRGAPDRCEKSACSRRTASLAQTRWWDHHHLPARTGSNVARAGRCRPKPAWLTSSPRVERRAIHAIRAILSITRPRADADGRSREAAPSS